LISGTWYTPYGLEVYMSTYNIYPRPNNRDYLPNADYNIGKAFYYFTSLDGVVEYMNILGDPSLVIPVNYVPVSLTSLVGTVSKVSTSSTTIDQPQSQASTISMGNTMTSTFGIALVSAVVVVVIVGALAISGSRRRQDHARKRSGAKQKALPTYCGRCGSHFSEEDIFCCACGNRRL
jgi:hypothetical protein